MSDIMTPIPFGALMEQILCEMKTKQSMFGVKKMRHEKEAPLQFAGGALENGLGVAAGPHTQLAQNIVACYAGGARFIETKTVQRLYGEDLGIPRPCIRAIDEGYNVEWSSEYSPRKAAEEYIKAHFAIHVISRLYDLGDPSHFQLNMSVGYNLEGIKDPSVDAFLNLLSDAKEDAFFQECQQWLLENMDKFEGLTEEDVKAIPSKICNTCTLSTMHGCPADEIEKIATYLITEKKLNTMIKMNPTLLGYDYCQQMMQDLGYGYIVFDPHSFEADLQFEDAVPMVQRLLDAAKRTGVFFGVKLTNTMAVKIADQELPGQEMYMSGKALYPLTISVAQKIADAFDGQIPVSYSGGADKGNIRAILEAGIFPITVCTTLLKTPGYDKLEGLASAMEGVQVEAANLDCKKLQELVDGLRDEKTNHKSEALIKKMDAQRGYEMKRQKDQIRCRVLCQNCVRVCPNRANTTLDVEGGSIIMHLDYACNECGNCQFFCVEPCTPYRDRMTYFSSVEALENSENTGFYTDGAKVEYRLYGKRGSGSYQDLNELPEEIAEAVKAQREQQPWLHQD